MKTADENANEEIYSHAEAFVALVEELRWFEVQ